MNTIKEITNNGQTVVIIVVENEEFRLQPGETLKLRQVTE